MSQDTKSFRRFNAEEFNIIIDSLENISDELKDSVKDSFKKIDGFIKYKVVISAEEIEEKSANTAICIAETKEQKKYFEEKPSILGYFDQKNNELILNPMYRGNLQEASHTLDHELLHMFSAKEYKQNGKMEKVAGFRNKNSDIGIGINEGMTEYLATLIEEGRKPIGYTENVKIAKMMHFILGNDLIKAYFKGEAELIEFNFDELSDYNEFMSNFDSYHRMLHSQNRNPALENDYLEKTYDKLVQLFADKEKERIDGRQGLSYQDYVKRTSMFLNSLGEKGTIGEKYIARLNEYYIQNASLGERISGLEIKNRLGNLTELQEVCKTLGNGLTENAIIAIANAQKAYIMTPNGKREIKIANGVAIWSKNPETNAIQVLLRNNEFHDFDLRRPQIQATGMEKQGLEILDRHGLKDHTSCYHISSKNNDNSYDYFIINNKGSKKSRIFYYNQNSNEMSEIPFVKNELLVQSAKRTTDMEIKAWKDRESIIATTKNTIQVQKIKSALRRIDRNNKIESISEIQDTEIKQKFLSDKYKALFLVHKVNRGENSFDLILQDNQGNYVPSQLIDSIRLNTRIEKNTEIIITEKLRVGGDNGLVWNREAGRANEVITFRQKGCCLAACKDSKNGVHVGTLSNENGKKTLTTIITAKTYENIYLKSQSSQVR